MRRALNVNKRLNNLGKTVRTRKAIQTVSNEKLNAIAYKSFTANRISFMKIVLIFTVVALVFYMSYRYATVGKLLY